jgi:hypothetical protein
VVAVSFPGNETFTMSVSPGGATVVGLDADDLRPFGA